MLRVEFIVFAISYIDFIFVMIFSDFVHEISGYIILKFEMSVLVSCQVIAPFYELSDQPS